MSVRHIYAFAIGALSALLLPGWKGIALGTIIIAASQFLAHLVGAAE